MYEYWKGYKGMIEWIINKLDDLYIKLVILNNKITRAVEKNNKK